MLQQAQHWTETVPTHASTEPKAKLDGIPLLSLPLESSELKKESEDAPLQSPPTRTTKSFKQNQGRASPNWKEKNSLAPPGFWVNFIQGGIFNDTKETSWGVEFNTTEGNRSTLTTNRIDSQVLLTCRLLLSVSPEVVIMGGFAWMPRAMRGDIHALSIIALQAPIKLLTITFNDISSFGILPSVLA
jgi:hypothetical protein